MSAKQSKRLRKAALGLAVAVSGAGKGITKRTLLNKDGSAVNTPNSLRGIVRSLKKGVKNSIIGKLPPQI